MRSLLLHSGRCSLLPTAPVVNVGILDSSTRAVDPALIIGSYACMLV